MTRNTLWLQAGSYAASVDRLLLAALWPTAASSGCALTAGGAMDIHIAPGKVAVPVTGGTTLCDSDAMETVTLPAAPGAGTDRIDLVICQVHAADIDGGTDGFVFTSVQGAPAASPVAPAVPANAVALGSVRLVGGSAAVTAGNITDLRPSGLSVPAAPQNTYSVRVQRSAGFTFPATPATSVIIPMNANHQNPNNYYNNTTGLYTCPVAGLYLISAKLGLQLTPNTGGACMIYVNGVNVSTTIAGMHPSTTAHEIVNVITWQCNAGDTIAMWGNTGVASGTIRGGNETILHIACIAPN